MSKSNIYKALAGFQQEVPVIHKATQGYGYSYSDLPTIFPVINPLLKKHGLGFTQLINGTAIDTIIFHCESGEEIKSTIEIPQNVSLKGMNDFQILGSAITYLRRYALSSALGLVTDKDTDAGGEQKPKEAPKKQTKSLDDGDVVIMVNNCKDLATLNALYKELSPIKEPLLAIFSKRKKEINGSTN